jgi:hypothetical protein
VDGVLPTKQPTWPAPTPPPTPAPTDNITACDPQTWDAVKNGEICTELSACSALIDFENIASTDCGAFCASHGLRCDDADDEKRNKCKVLGRTSDQYTCNTPIVDSTGWDAICYCSNSPINVNIVGGGDSAESSSITAERQSIIAMAALAIAAVAFLGGVMWAVRTVRSKRSSYSMDSFEWDDKDVTSPTIAIEYNSPSSQPAGREAFCGTSPSHPFHRTRAFEPEYTRRTATSSLTDISNGVGSDPNQYVDFDEWVSSEV